MTDLLVLVEVTLGKLSVQRGRAGRVYRVPTDVIQAFAFLEIRVLQTNEGKCEDMGNSVSRLDIETD